MEKPKSLIRLTESFAKLPGVGTKSAERMAYAILDFSEEDVKEFANALNDFKTNIHCCPICGYYIDEQDCPICSNPDRDQTTLLVVTSPKDVLAIEKSDGFHGLYHVLNGEISMAKGHTIDTLNIDALVERIKANNFKEVIIATNPTVDGETTALYIAKVLEPLSCTVTRLAYGLQMGANLDYTDQITLFHALEGRHKI